LCFNIAYLPAFFILANKHLGIQTNTLFLLFLVAYILSTLLVHYTSKVTYSFGKIKILAAATFTTAVFGFLYAFAQSILVFSIALIGISLSLYVWRVSFKTISMDLARPRIRGEQLSFIQTMSGFGNVLGPLISGLLIDLFFIQAPFLVSACLILGMSIILYLKRF